MEFRIVQNVSNEITEQADLINLLSIKLGDFFISKKYSESLEILYVGFICVNDQFKDFFKPRRPKYTKSQRIFEFDIHFDIQEISNGDKDYIKMIVLKKIILSIPLITKLISDFDEEKFKRDLISFEFL